MNDNICPKCKKQVAQTDKFCQSCGFQLNHSEPSKQTSSEGPKTFVSKGSYSGKMVKGKTSKGWKIFRNILIVIVVLAILALIIWFQVDPEAGKKLTEVAMGVAFMAVIFFVGWLFTRGKKGRKGDWDDDQYNDVADDDDDD